MAVSGGLYLGAGWSEDDYLEGDHPDTASKESARLPTHGYEGQGPEHSSGRLERFLLLAAEDNIQITNASTAAQYFHLLRRQMRRHIHKPLAEFSPKSLLRDRRARSTIDELTHGTFEEVLGDRVVNAATVNRVILASGKVAHEATTRRDEIGAPVAGVRVQQLYPVPPHAHAGGVRPYHQCRELGWLQGGPANLGAWGFARGRLLQSYADRFRITGTARRESGSPATGSAGIHAQEQRGLLDRAFSEQPGDNR